MTSAATLPAVDITLTRTVWALVTANPWLSVPELAGLLRQPKAPIVAALRLLRAQGYLGAKVPNAPRPVLVPFITGCVEGRR